MESRVLLPHSEENTTILHTPEEKKRSQEKEAAKNKYKLTYRFTSPLFLCSQQIGLYINQIDWFIIHTLNRNTSVDVKTSFSEHFTRMRNVQPGNKNNSYGDKNRSY